MTRGWRGEREAHGLCARGVRVRSEKVSDRGVHVASSIENERKRFMKAFNMFLLTGVVAEGYKYRSGEDVQEAFVSPVFEFDGVFYMLGRVHTVFHRVQPDGSLKRIDRGWSSRTSFLPI